ncbi:MAG: GAF domain-containing sensor histidine kinase [Anaerolineales bacterium]|nr:GAF domain-containing sensor histidine kinase [Anaerolineales bacterium]
MDQKHLIDELDRRREIAESLRDIISMINANLPLDTLLERAVSMAAQRLNATACVLHRFDMENQMLVHLASYGLDKVFKSGASRPFHNLKVSGGENYLYATLQHQPTYANYPPLPDRLNEIKNDPTIPAAIKAERIALRQRFAGSFSVPLFIQDQIYGGMVFYYDKPQDFSDEQIQLGLTFAEQMVVAIQNARLHQAEQDRQRELHMLLEVAAAANSSLDLDEMLVKTLELIVALVGATRAGVLLRAEENGELVPHTLRPEQEIAPAELDEMVKVCEAVVASGETLYIAPDETRGWDEPGALMPLQIRGRAIGTLVIIGSRGGTFVADQLALFKSIADQVSVAIENARLFEQAEKAAVATERNRLARDLHDAVTQTLFSSSLIADVLPKIWERDPAEGQRRLEELRQLTRGALSEMRTLLLELRPAALVDTDLDDLIGHQVNAFVARTRIPVAYSNECEHNPPPDVKEVFYRIAQEAFNNIAKHADASAVTVRLKCQKGRADLTIQDDGIGFDPAATAAEGLGLNIMRERTQGIGAQFELHSQIREGTRLHIFWQQPHHKEHKDD